MTPELSHLIALAIKIGIGFFCLSFAVSSVVAILIVKEMIRMRHDHKDLDERANSIEERIRFGIRRNPRKKTL